MQNPVKFKVKARVEAHSLFIAVLGLLFPGWPYSSLAQCLDLVAECRDIRLLISILSRELVTSIRVVSSLPLLANCCDTLAVFDPKSMFSWVVFRPSLPCH
jgi:hypothetical protein